MTLIETARSRYPADLTSYDLIKALAVIIMIIDHVGHYFYPEQMWFRAIGRTGFPVWFFLVGYASSRDISPKLVIGMLVLAAANFVVGMTILPLNALATILLIRLLIDPCMKPVMDGRLSLWKLGVLLIALIPITIPFFEYGSIGLITAIFGYLVRHRDSLKNPRVVTYYMVFSLTVFVLMQLYWFKFSIPQFALVIAGTLMIRMLLLNFQSVTYPDLSQKMFTPLKTVIQIMGRYTLEIYVAHLLLFKVAAVLLEIDPHRFAWFRLPLF